jgi:trehalose 6-phosphate phosphatase
MTIVSSPLPAPPSLPNLMIEGRIALFLDFDGTLVDIAAKPDAVTVPQGLRQGLDRLGQRLGGALALVTGRSIDNLEDFLGQPMLHLAGSHGGDVRAPGGVTLRKGKALPAPVIDALNSFAAANGLLFERKAHGGALHYRKHPEREADARDFAAGLADAHGLATKTGKCVIELVWPGADKGGAVDLLAMRAPFKGATPVFIGDDVTDEDGFAACTRLGGFGIAVGERPSATARYSLSTVKDVHTWLEL